MGLQKETSPEEKAFLDARVDRFLSERPKYEEEDKSAVLTLTDDERKGLEAALELTRNLKERAKEIRHGWAFAHLTCQEARIEDTLRGVFNP